MRLRLFQFFSVIATIMSAVRPGAPTSNDDQPNDKKSKTDATTEFADLQGEELIDNANELSMENIHLM